MSGGQGQGWRAKGGRRGGVRGQWMEVARREGRLAPAVLGRGGRAGVAVGAAGCAAVMGRATLVRLGAIVGCVTAIHLHALVHALVCALASALSDARLRALLFALLHALLHALAAPTARGELARPVSSLRVVDVVGADELALGSVVLPRHCAALEEGGKVKHAWDGNLSG